MIKLACKTFMRTQTLDLHRVESVWKITERLHKQLELQMFCPLAELTWLELKINIFCTKKIKKK